MNVPGGKFSKNLLPGGTSIPDSRVSATVLSVLLGMTSRFLDNIIFGAAAFPVTEFSTVVAVVSGVVKSSEVIWL